MDKQELIMTIARDLLIEAIRKHLIHKLPDKNNPNPDVFATYVEALEKFSEGVAGVYDKLKQRA
jgi:hypothetical protein